MKITSKSFLLDRPHGAYLLNWNYEKSAKCNPTFLQNNFFCIFSKYGQVSKYTALLNKFSFPKKGNKNKSNFRMVNLCNGETKDFVELWEIILYSETCSNEHLCKTTNAESTQANSRHIVTF